MRSVQVLIDQAEAQESDRDEHDLPKAAAVGCASVQVPFQQLQTQVSALEMQVQAMCQEIQALQEQIGQVESWLQALGAGAQGLIRARYVGGQPLNTAYRRLQATCESQQ